MEVADLIILCNCFAVCIKWKSTSKVSKWWALIQNFEYWRIYLRNCEPLRIFHFIFPSLYEYLRHSSEAPQIELDDWRKRYFSPQYRLKNVIPTKAERHYCLSNNKMQVFFILRNCIRIIEYDLTNDCIVVWVTTFTGNGDDFL